MRFSFTGREGSRKVQIFSPESLLGCLAMKVIEVHDELSLPENGKIVAFKSRVIFLSV